MITSGVVFDGERSIDLEPGATTLIDASRYGNDYTFLGAGEPDWVQLPSGLWVMDFDGTDDYALLANYITEISVTTNWSVSLWLYADDITTDQQLWQNGNGANNRCGIGILTGHLGVNIYNGAYVRATGNVVISTWTHLVGVSTAGVMTAYINGLPVAGTDIIGTLRDSPSSMIGSSRDGPVVFRQFFDGKIGLHSIYNYPLSAGQARNIYESERYLFGV